MRSSWNPTEPQRVIDLDMTAKNKNYIEKLIAEEKLLLWKKEDK